MGWDCSSVWSHCLDVPDPGFNPQYWKVNPAGLQLLFMVLFWKTTHMLIYKTWMIFSFSPVPFSCVWHGNYGHTPMDCENWPFPQKDKALCWHRIIMHIRYGPQATSCLILLSIYFSRKQKIKFATQNAATLFIWQYSMFQDLTEKTLQVFKSLQWIVKF